MTELPPPFAREDVARRIPTSHLPLRSYTQPAAYDTEGVSGVGVWTVRGGKMQFDSGSPPPHGKTSSILHTTHLHRRSLAHERV